MLENIRNAITRLPMDRLGRNLSGRIPSCSQYWKCYNSSYKGTDWDDSWVVASKQHICCKTVSLVLVVTANCTVNILVFFGRNLGGHIESSSQYWTCYNSSYDGTDWDDSWVQATHLLQNRFLGIGRYC